VTSLHKALSVLTLFLCLFAAVGCEKEKTAEEDQELYFHSNAENSDVPTVILGVPAESDTLVGEELVLEIRVKRVTDLYGLAFRIQYDPDVLRFQEMNFTSLWKEKAVGAAREPLPGLLVGAVTLTGEAEGLQAEDATAAVLRFEVLSKLESALSFVQGRSILMASDGIYNTGVDWAGGELRLESKR